MMAEMSAWWVRTLEASNPGLQALFLGLATFVQEDIPTVTAALLAGTGRMPWATALAACFFGIWVGDALLYLGARGIGRGLVTEKWLGRRWVDPELVARCESWFARRGLWLLVTSRFVPGTRLPTYLAAGFLRLPFHRFLLVTGCVVASWTILVFTAARFVGPPLGEGLRRWNGNPVAWLVAISFVVLLLRPAFRLIASARRVSELSPGAPTRLGRQLRAWLGRWYHWEFWPAWLFYSPVVVNALRLAVKHGGLTTPTAANPGIPNGGMIGESKSGILGELSRVAPEFTAEAWRVDGDSETDRIECLRRIVVENSIVPPFILKPDVGERGIGVKRIRGMAAAEAYVKSTGAALVVQRFVPGPFEAGVFYYRFPDEERGRIFAITEKIFPVVVGDGRRTIEDLVWRDSRARWVAERYLSRLADRRFEVPTAGEAIPLVLTGNHAQGCIFRDGNRWWSRRLEERIDAISRALPGFHIGRFDMRFESEDAFGRGEGFRILELNGASAEATHIYDSRYTLWHAYATLFRQWELVFAIGAANRARGSQPTPVSELVRQWRLSRRAAATYPRAD